MTTTMACHTLPFNQNRKWLISSGRDSNKPIPGCRPSNSSGKRGSYVSAFGSMVPKALHPNLVELLDAKLKGFRVYSMTKRYDMGNLWALYADGHRGYCLEFENIGPLFENAKDVNYLNREDMEIAPTEPSLLQGHFLFCKTREWQCEEEVRLVLPPHEGRSKVKFQPAWLTRIILGKAMSDENKNLIRL